MTDLGANWIEIGGDSEIVAGEAVIPAGAMIIAVPHADRGAQKVIVQMMDLQPYKKFRIIINTNTSGTAYDYVEYECTNTAAGSDYVSYLRVGNSGTGDADEIADTYTAGDDMYLQACRTPGGLYGSAEHSEIIAWMCDDEPTEVHAGLMNNSSSLDVEFDNFQILKYLGTNSALFPGDPDTVHRCFYCACECDGACLPETLNLNILGSGLSSCLDTDVTLTYQPGHDPFQWYGSATLKDPTCPAFGNTVQFLFICNGDQDFTIETDWGLINQSGWTSVTPGGWTTRWRASPTSIQCDPLELVFGPFTETVSEPCDPCEGTYYLTVSE